MQIDRIGPNEMIESDRLLEINVHKSFSKLDFFEVKLDSNDHKFLGTIFHPQVLWDMNEISQMKNPDRIICLRCCNQNHCDMCRQFDQFTRGPSLIRYDNLTFLYPKELFTGVDSFLLIESFLGNKDRFGRIDSLMDLGAGCGLIGLCIMKNMNSVSKAYFSDINEKSRETVLLNFRNNLFSQKIEVTVGAGFSGFHCGLRVDLIVCAPPYISFHERDHCTQQDNLDRQSIFGLDLLETLLLEGSNFSSNIVLVYSSLSKSEVESLKKRNPPAHIDTLGQYTIPFTISSVLENRQLTEDYLEKGLLQIGTDGHSYLHTIRIEAINYQQ